MSRYKGRPKAIERDFPHIVETIVPLGGFGKRLNDMYDFHAHNSIRARLGLGRRDEHGREAVRWCFADPTIAFIYANEFRGTYGSLRWLAMVGRSQPCAGKGYLRSSAGCLKRKEPRVIQPGPKTAVLRTRNLCAVGAFAGSLRSCSRG
jgi:hypothetical protein